MRIFLLWFCLAPLLSAAPVACVTGSLASYTTLSMGCTVGPVTFAGFSATASQGTLISPAGIELTPLELPDAVGFRLTLNTAANSLEVRDVLINYTVSFAQSASIELFGSSVTPDGATSGVLDLCSGNFPGSLPTGCTGALSNAVAVDVGVLSALTDRVPLAPGAYDVFVNLIVDGGQTGAASLGSATVLHGVPEPATWVMLAAPLLFLAVRRARHAPPVGGS
jgi:hypothetical protein